MIAPLYPAAMSAGTDVVFERVLLPHRSLPPSGFQVLMLSLGLVSLAVGIGFVSVGAWPICGFFGLDVAALYLAFRISYRSARQREVLRLVDDDFTVERVGVYGERRVWRFQPFWLRVVLEEQAGELEPPADRLARQEPRHRRLSRRGNAPRTGRQPERGSRALARRPQLAVGAGGRRAVTLVRFSRRSPAQSIRRR